MKKQDCEKEVENYDQEFDELLDCPFCGSRPVAYLVGNDYRSRLNKESKIVVSCKGCYVYREIGFLTSSKEEITRIAFKAWNSRKG